MKKKIIVVLILILILTIIASFLGVAIQKGIKKREESNLTEQEREDRTYENSIINKLTSMSEVQRIQTYFGEFIKYIEDERYDKSYSLLNESFKNKYFPSIEQFTEYVQSKYPRKNIVVDYNEIDTYGDLFVLTVSISDIINDDFESFEQRIVIRENSANDYKISFQVEPDKEGEKEQNTIQEEISDEE